MTIAVAVSKGGRTVIAADSLVNFGGQRFPVENCRFSKIYRLGDSLLAWAGWSLYTEMLDAYLEATPPPTLYSEAEVFSFFVRFWKALRSDFTLLSSGRERDHPFADLDSVFLLVNKAGIFRVAGDLDVTLFQQYSAVGTGSKYALGALRVMYDNMDDPAEMASRAVQVGIDFDVHCGGSVDLVEMPVPAL